MKYILLLVCFPAMLFAQGKDNFKLPEIIPPSPTVASLMHFEEVPVDYYTGQPDINIPLHSKKLSADITMPIALKYSTLGVRLTERSGWTGTGWSMEAGGTISRTVRGLPDDAKNPPGVPGTGIHNLPSNEFWSYDGLPDLVKNEYLWNIAGTANTKYDSELDLYQFSIVGATGRFVILKVGSQLQPKLLTKDQNIKIEVTNFNPDNYSVLTFTLTDANGNKYIFGEGATESTKSTPWAISYPVQHTGVSPDPNAPDAETISTSAWHLTRITSANNTELATLSYTANIQEQYDSYVSTTLNKFDNSQYWSSYLTGSMNDPNVEYNKMAFLPEKVLSGSEITVQTKKLSKITFRDKTTVNFILSGTLEHPESHGAVLDRVELKNAQGQLIKRYIFTYNTTTPPNQDTGPGEEIFSRLWLMQVTETPAGMSSLRYKLEYFDKANLPAYGRGDAWGYAQADARPSGGIYDFNAFKRGLLTRIVYPTGGVKDFEYEPHSFSYEGDRLLTTSETDDNPQNYYDTSEQAIFYAEDDDVTSTPNPAPAIQTTLNQTRALVYVNIMDESQPVLDYSKGSDYYELIIKKAGSSTPVAIFDLNDQSFPKVVYLNIGTYNFYIQPKLLSTPTEGGVISVDAAISIHYGNKKLGNNYRQYLIGGGSRIKEVSFKENQTASESKRKLMYFYDYPKPGETVPGGAVLVNPNAPHLRSSGSVDAKLGSLYKEYPYQHRAFLKEVSSGQCQGTSTDGVAIGYTVETNEQNMQLTKGGYVGYKYVRVREVGNSLMDGNGYTAYTYTSPQDYPTPDDVFYEPFKPAPNLDYKRGLLLKKEVFDMRGKKMQEIANEYDVDYIVEDIATSYVHATMPCVWAQYYSNYTAYKNKAASVAIPCGLTKDVCGSGSPAPAPYSFIPDTLQACWATLEATVKKEYFHNGTTVDSLETRTEYDYNNGNYQIKRERRIVKEGSETNVYETRYQYAIDGYTSSLFDSSPENEHTVIESMRTTYNMINKPLVTETFKNDEPLHKVINKYKIYNGQPQIKEIESLKADGTREDRVVFSRYDALGNPLEVSMKEGTKICYIWGYNETLPIVKVEGVASYTAMENALPQNFITNLKAASNASTYNETTLKNMLGTLRTTLSGSMVTTLVHDPAKGVELLTDPRGDFFTYEYDNMGRLKWVKDRDGNLVSEHYYHYRTEF